MATSKGINRLNGKKPEFVAAARRISAHTTPFDFQTMTITVTPNGERDRSVANWGLVEDVDGPVGEIALGFTTLIDARESGVSCQTMRARANNTKTNLGELHAVATYKNRERIPHSWRDFVLVFTGTVRCGPFGGRYVAYLIWNDGNWYLRWLWLGGSWDHNIRIMCPI